jgi:hypothetical protein
MPHGGPCGTGGSDFSIDDGVDESGDAAATAAARGPVPQLPDEFGWLLMAIYIVIGGLTLCAGVFRIFAGISNLRYRRRAFGIVALFVGLVPIVTCYCAPTSLALLIYGMIVYLNDQSARAFVLGDQGMSASEITDRLAGTSGREPRDRIDLDS